MNNVLPSVVAAIEDLELEVDIFAAVELARALLNSSHSRLDPKEVTHSDIF